MDRDVPADSAIVLHDVVFAYPNTKPVLSIPNLSIAAGEQVFLQGPSGSGKTTLLSLIAGVHTPTAGSLAVLGCEMTKASASSRDRLRGARMGYIFQGFNLIPYLSVAENIALPCQLHPERLRRVRSGSLSKEVERLAQRLDLSIKLNDPIQKLSVGQQQRVAIARALIGSPSLVIADEPTSSLDSDRRDGFLALLREMLQETDGGSHATTLLFVSHDRALAHHFERSLSLTEVNRAAEGCVQ